MTDSINIQILTKDNLKIYIKVGKRSYLQHYLDFWEDNDPSAYIDESFTAKALLADLSNKNAQAFIIYAGRVPIGVLKIIPHKEVGSFSKKEALWLQKIYILKEYSNRGIGSQVLAFVENFARKKNKQLVWLCMMVKGRALNFYLKNGYEIHSTKKLDYEGVKDEKRKMYVMVKKL